jgi:hypothetical protein
MVLDGKGSEEFSLTVSRVSHKVFGRNTKTAIHYERSTDKTTSTTL